MKKLVLTVLGIFLGILLIPALYAFAMGVGGMIIGFLTNPRFMLMLIGLLGIISLPGLIVGMIVKRK